MAWNSIKIQQIALKILTSELDTTMRNSDHEEAQSLKGWQTMGGPVLKHWSAGRVILEACDNHAFKFLLW